MNTISHNSEHKNWKIVRIFQENGNITVGGGEFPPILRWEESISLKSYRLIVPISQWTLFHDATTAYDYYKHITFDSAQQRTHFGVKSKETSLVQLPAFSHLRISGWLQTFEKKKVRTFQELFKNIPRIFQEHNF